MKELRRKFLTPSNIEIKEVYDKEDLGEIQIEKPGEFPYTRGIHKNMYRGRLWTMRQYSGFGSAEETNERFKYLLLQGQTGLSTAFDLPTQLGYDPDEPFSEGEIGKTGVSISNPIDMDILFKDIPLDVVSTSMTINATAGILLGLYIYIAKQRNIEIEKLSGTTQNDILKEFAARGNYIYPIEPSVRLVGDIIEFCSKYLPKWNPISISGYHYREAGANAVQELAFTFADAIAYVEEVLRRGIDVDEFAPRLSFFFNGHIYFFEEIAKFRAARRIWAKIMKYKFKAKNENSLKLRFHTQTAGSSLTAQEPENNIIRTTIEALAAVLGGTQSLHTNSYDEALALPTEKSARIALRTQQIIAYESGVADTVDPLAGSYFVEKLTNEIEEKVWEYLEKIEKMGGAVECIKNGYFQNEIAESSYRYQKEIESRERYIIGVNIFKTEENQKIEIFRLPDEVVEKILRRVKDFKENRSKGYISALEELKKKAKTNENLMVYIIRAIEEKATLGEISHALREVWGEYDRI
ncbi:MAG: methylmalonyl-CoA mutase family protein [candidate division WOR-3 bacterium]|nr:methylmalonyl-CoA mutase family protein [candidate division WOR-3 bacterium]